MAQFSKVDMPTSRELLAIVSEFGLPAYECWRAGRAKEMGFGFVDLVKDHKLI